MEYEDEAMIVDAMPGEPEADVQEEPAGLTPEQFIMAVSQSSNLVPDLSDTEAAGIAQRVLTEFAADEESMSDWAKRMEKGLELARLVKETKSYPFDGASNVKYPLITSAALQFNARAYPAIVTQEPVKVAVNGADPEGRKAQRAKRVGAFMSWQLMTQMTEWEEDTDRMLVMLPIVGTVIRKIWHAPIKGRPCSRVLEPGAFFVSDKASSIADAPRCSEVFTLYPWEVREREHDGRFVEGNYPEKENDDPYEFIEQHRREDLDGDGYPEPYIVTICRETQAIVRVVANFEAEKVRFAQDGAVMSIDPDSYYVAYHFMPAMDGGFWGTGLGMLLGDISESVNTIINMLIDAGHMSSLGGGFLGREFKTNGGVQRFAPGEWKTPNSGGNDLRTAIVPMNHPGPSPVLFQMLGLLIDAGREISSTTDIMTGDAGGKVQTATTTLALIEQGMQVFTAAYKRVFRSLRREYELLAAINAKFLPDQTLMEFHDEPDEEGNKVIPISAKAEFTLSGMDIGPVADPRAVTKMQEMARAQLLMELADAEKVDTKEATRRILEAASIDEIGSLIPEPTEEEAAAQRQAAEMQKKAAEFGLMTAEAEMRVAMAEVEKVIAETQKLMADAAGSMADAESTAAGTKLHGLLARMKDTARDIDQRSAGGMAGAPGNGAPAGLVQAGVQGQSPGDVRSVLLGGGGL